MSGDKFSPGMIGVSFGVENKFVHGVFYSAGGDAPCPTVVLCHGFPGFEKNGDLAHALRRAGFNVLLFSYRGAWGSQGDFAFSHVIVDTCKAVRYVQSDEFPMKERVLKEKIILVGHSMGGFAAIMAAARLRDVKHLVSIAGWNIGRTARESRANKAVHERVNGILSGAMVLRGTDAATLWDEMQENENDYDLCSVTGYLEGKNVLMVSAKNDADTSPEDNHIPLFDSFSANKKIRVEEKWLDSDHAFSNSRVELAGTIIDWLKAQ